MSPLLAYDDAGEVLGKPIGKILERGSWYVLTTRGMFVTVDPREVAYAQWWELGDVFHWRATSLKFQVADWLRFGAFRFHEKFAQAQELFPFWDEQTLMNIQRVGNRLPPSRRREELPFEYHEAVAASQPAQQVKMLEAAVKDPGVTRQVLRDMARSYEQPSPSHARAEFMAIPLRRAIAEVDGAIPRLEGEARHYAVNAVEALREALRLVESERRKVA